MVWSFLYYISIQMLRLFTGVDHPNLCLQADFASGKVTLLTYLRDLYPNDWEHFKERVARMALAKGHREAEITLRFKNGYKGITELDFAAGNVLAPWALELQLWASYRSQVGKLLFV